MKKKFTIGHSEIKQQWNELIDRSLLPEIESKCPDQLDEVRRLQQLVKIGAYKAASVKLKEIEKWL